jgi:hypothetical protein
VNWSAELFVLVPPGAVTVTSTVPAVPGGEVALSCVELVTVKATAAVPNCTAVAPVKFVPVTVTEVPPVVIPDVGLMPVTVGGGGTV